MTLKKRFETNCDEPTDDRLVDYLLGESASGLAGEVGSSRPDGEGFGSDQAIERWLAAGEANLIRLERLAEVVAAIGVGGFESAVESSVAVTARPLAYRPIVAGLLALAASISLLVVWRPGLNTERLADDRVAVAWAEMMVGSNQIASFTGDANDLWIAGDADEIGVESITDWPLADEASDDGGFASGDDATPQWLLVAVTQMSDGFADDTLRESESDVIDSEEVR